MSREAAAEEVASYSNARDLLVAVVVEQQSSGSFLSFAGSGPGSPCTTWVGVRGWAMRWVRTPTNRGGEREEKKGGGGEWDCRGLAFLEDVECEG